MLITVIDQRFSVPCCLLGKLMSIFNILMTYAHPIHNRFIIREHRKSKLHNIGVNMITALLTPFSALYGQFRPFGIHQVVVCGIGSETRASILVVCALYHSVTKSHERRL